MAHPRAKVMWFAAALLALALLTVVSWVYGPRKSQTSECGFCGYVRHQEWRVGVEIEDRVMETQASRWVQQLYPDHHEHEWLPASSINRRHWFGSSIAASGGGMVHKIEGLRGQVGDEAAASLLADYHQALAQGESNAWVFVQELQLRFRGKD